MGAAAGSPSTRTSRVPPRGYRPAKKQISCKATLLLQHYFQGRTCHLSLFIAQTPPSESKKMLSKVVSMRDARRGDEGGAGCPLTRTSRIPPREFRPA